MPETVCSQILYGSAEYKTALALRDEVLRKPLGLQFSAEELEQEREHFHLVCHADGQLMGCLVLVPQEQDIIKMLQVAIAPTAQGQGIGRGLVQFAENFARDHGYSLMTLHARDTAIPFYEKLGYTRVGEPFEEVTIMHWEMEKSLLVG